MNEELKIIIAADVTDLQTGVKKAEDSIKGLGESANKAKPQIANANFALTNLSRVAQDLPFGFIAIQNNLDPLLGSFQGLVTQTGSIGGAFKALGSSLLGGAGLAFAFSVITSTVTSLIQTYGSLDNALQVIFASNKNAAEAQATFNKELKKGFEDFGGEAAKIDILVKKLTDLKQPYADRQAAYVELKKIQPDILIGISEENALSGISSTLIQNNAKQRIELLKLKIEENAITKVLNEQKVKENELSDKKVQADKDLAATTALKNKLENQALSASQQSTLEVLINKEKSQKATVESLAASLKDLTTVSDNYYKKLENNLGAISSIDAATQNALKTSKAESDAKKTQTKANDDYAASVKKLTKAEQEQKAKQAAERTQQALIPNFGVERNKPINPGATQGKLDNFQGGVIKPELAAAAFLEKQRVDELNLSYQKYAETVKGFVGPAIDGLFSSLQNGTNVFEAIGQSVKALIIDIVKAIAKTLILNAITTAIGGGAGAGIFGGLFKALGGSLGGVASPQFTGGAGLSGGMALSGQVVFVQRGTDLVGVLNRGNSQINRVG
jgi:hypothetical protein